MSLADVSPAVLVMVGVLLVVQVGLEVWAIIDIVRRPATSVAGGSKLIWILVVILVSFVGALVYFAFGRRDVGIASEAGAPRGTPARPGDTVDLIYGPKDGAGA